MKFKNLRTIALINLIAFNMLHVTVHGLPLWHSQADDALNKIYGMNTLLKQDAVSSKVLKSKLDPWTEIILNSSEAEISALIKRFRNAIDSAVQTLHGLQLSGQNLQAPDVVKELQGQIVLLTGQLTDVHQDYASLAAADELKGQELIAAIVDLANQHQATRNDNEALISSVNQFHNRVSSFVQRFGTDIKTSNSTLDSLEPQFKATSSPTIPQLPPIQGGGDVLSTIIPGTPAIPNPSDIVTGVAETVSGLVNTVTGVVNTVTGIVGGLPGANLPIPSLPGVPSVPGLPSLPGLPGLAGANTNAREEGSGLPTIPVVSDVVLPVVNGVVEGVAGVGLDVVNVVSDLPLPPLPVVSTLPALLETLPGLVSGLPTIPGTLPIPGTIPGSPDLGGIIAALPSLPSTLPIPGLPSLPSLPGLPVLPSTAATSPVGNPVSSLPVISNVVPAVPAIIPNLPVIGGLIPNAGQHNTGGLSLLGRQRARKANNNQ